MADILLITLIGGTNLWKILFTKINLTFLWRFQVSDFIFQKDTIYTFEISSHNNDEAIQKITERLGKPVSNSIGELVWEKISLPYIGKNLKIVLKDGAFTISNDRAEFVPFKDVASKEKLMNESSKNVLRKTEIFVFANGKNAITSTVNQGRMLSFLEGILEK